MDEIKVAKEIINKVLEKEDIKVSKIILFGSRAKGDYNKDSDFDILIIIDKELEFNKIKEIVGKIQLKLAEKKIPNDIILRSVKQFNKAKKVIGNISYYAEKEGIII